MARERKGTIVRVRTGPHKGCWQPIIQLADGSKKRLAPFKRGTSEAYARERTHYWQEQADAKGLRRPNKTPERAAEMTSDSGERWVETWLADRRAAGYTSVKENESHWRVHAREVLGTKHIKDWTRDDVRTFSLALTEKVRERRISLKSAQNIWGTVTKMCDDACAHNSPKIRVRDEDPASGVRGPRGRNRDRDEQGLHFLYQARSSSSSGARWSPLGGSYS